MKRNYWSEDEDNILRQHFPSRGLAGCWELIPTRTAGAMSIRASKLGLSSSARIHNNGSEQYKERIGFLSSRPRHIRGEAFSDEWFRSCNVAFVASMREHHPERERANSEDI
jgi:hypothetical protein